MYYLVFSLPPQEKARSWKFPPECVPGEGTTLKRYQNFPTGFDIVGFMLTWGAVAAYLVSGFPMKRLRVVLKSVSLWEEGECGTSCSIT